jgi:hypothetical protein
MKTYGLDSSGYFIDKDPASKLDYSNDWSEWLVTGDTISLSTWTADAGINLSGESISGAVTTTFADGGTSGATYKITNRITTTGGRIDERSFRLIVKDQ